MYPARFRALRRDDLRVHRSLLPLVEVGAGFLQLGENGESGAQRHRELIQRVGGGIEGNGQVRGRCCGLDG